MFDWKWNRAWGQPWKIAFGFAFIGFIVAIVVAVGAWAFNEVVQKIAGVVVPYVKWITSICIDNSLKVAVVFFIFIIVIIFTAKAVWR